MTISDRQIILLHVFPSFACGGVQVRFAAIANELGRKYSHRILAIDGVYSARRLIAAEVDHEFIKLDCDKTATFVNLPKFRRLIRESRANLMLTYNWGAIEWAFANLTGIMAHVHVEDGFGPDEAERRLMRRNWFRRLALSRSSAVVVPSRTLCEIASEEWGVPSWRLRYIPNGVACEQFGGAPDPDVVGQLDLGTDLPVVGTVAPLRPEKNLGRLIGAFASVVKDTPARLVIVGDGSERETLEWLAAEHGIAEHVTFAGHFPRPEDILGSFDLFTLSSDTEQMPLSVLEAMAARLPVAGVDVGDVKTMVADDNAPFIVAKSEEKLAEAIRCLIRNPERCRGIGAANQARVRKEFDEERMIMAYDGVFGLGRSGTP